MYPSADIHVERRACQCAAERGRTRAGASTLWLGDGTFGTTNIAWDGWRGVFVQTRADNATFLQARSVRKPAIRVSQICTSGGCTGARL
jgi:hypothetical protein